jgi:outer membrane receptor protein involved in Fe transport
MAFAVPLGRSAEQTATGNPSTSSPSIEATAQNSASAAPNPEGDTMKPYVVVEPAFRAFLTPGELLWIKLYWDLGIDYGIGGLGANRSGLFVMTPLREPQHPARAAFTAYVLDGKDIKTEPSGSVAGALSSLAEVGLSGRADILGSLPQGEFLSLRGVGAGGPGACVLLDGVPFNDPFGGWVPWAEEPREGLARVEVVPGGGATAWGPGALGGVVQFFTLPPRGELTLKPGSLTEGGPVDPALTKQVVVGTGEIAAEAGGFGTRSLEFVAAQPTNGGVLQVLGGDFSTDGYSVVSPAQRGPIDDAAWNRHEWLEARWRQLLGKRVVLTATVRASRESHGDGTPYQQGSTSGSFASVALASQPSAGFTWNGVAYVQNGQSAGTFSAVNAARSAETPVLNQFAEPETSFGAAWNGAWREAGGSSTSAGVDYHFVRGEAREDFSFVNGTFTRELTAGGEQGDLGAFVLRDQSVAWGLRAVFGVRLDAWDDSGGHQTETDLASGSLLGSDRFAADSGAEFSPSVGLVWQPEGDLRMHVNGQQAFSRPTLAELYQPCGHDAIVTEPNAGLQTERNTSVEAGAEYTIHLGADRSKKNSNTYYRPPLLASGNVVVAATVFSNELRDAIGNLNLTPGTGGYPIFGALPAGYVAQQLINLDRSRIQGVTGSVQWSPNSAFSAYAFVVFDDPTIDRVGIAPGLVGKQIAGVSRRSCAVSVRWRASERLTVRASMRALGPNFVDDENTLRLGDAVVADLGAVYSIARHAELFLAVANLGNDRFDTSRSADGVYYIASPRLAHGGLRFSW